MAIFRKIHTSFWSDSFTSDLDKDQKLFYLYLLTNERTSQCGIYEITKKQMSFDLGYGIETISKLLKFFISAKKVKYNEQTNEIAIKNWSKYNVSNSPKVKSCIDKEIKKVKDINLIQYIYSIDTEPQEEEEQEQEKKTESCFSFDEFWEMYGKKVSRKDAEKKYNKLSESVRSKIKETLPTYLSTIKDKQFQKDPTTYINKECWNDEIVTKTTPDIPNTMDLDWRYKNLIK